MNALTIACRSLARRPSFTITAVLTLAFGVSTTTAMFSVVDAVLLKPLPFPNADRLVTVMESNPARTQSISLVAPGRLLDWDHANRTFEALSGSYAENVTDTSDVEPLRLQGRRVAPRYFAVFGMAPSAGRTFSEDEERFGGPQAAVISDGLWTRRYGHAATAIGRRLVFGGVGYTIRQGFRIGASTYYGPYLDRQYPYFFPGEANPNQLPAYAYGLDVQWGKGPWNAWGELQHFTMEYHAIPTFTQHTGYAELRRVLNPRWYVAARLGYLRSAYAGSESYEVAAGFRPNTHQLLKFSYQIQHGLAYPGTEGNVAAIELVTFFRAFSLARN